MLQVIRISFILVSLLLEDDDGRIVVGGRDKTSGLILLESEPCLLQLEGWNFFGTVFFPLSYYPIRPRPRA